MTFDTRTREAFVDRFGVDPDQSYQELQLDIRVGGPVSARILRSVELAEHHRRPLHPVELGEQQRLVMVDYTNGLMAKESGARLGIATETVKTVRRVVKEKLGSGTVAEAAELCCTLGLLDEAA